MELEVNTEEKYKDMVIGLLYFFHVIRQHEGEWYIDRKLCPDWMCGAIQDWLASGEYVFLDSNGTLQLTTEGLKYARRNFKSTSFRR